MNTTQTDLYCVLEAVRAIARAHGVEVVATELVGVLLTQDAARALQSALGLASIDPQQIVAPLPAAETR